jgi:3-hydroxyisobutyrate dehydrogenase-like beta-hydroxyacid dehydrogenase
VIDQVGFLGLGSMGGRMAGRLVESGMTVCGWSRTSGKAASVTGVRAMSSATEVAWRCDTVLGCLLDDEAVEQVYVPLLEVARPGQLFVEHGTFSPALARLLSSMAEKRGAHFVDAPVTGGPEGATAGTLVTMVGANAPVFDRVVDVVSAYSADVVLIGPSGRGLELKVVNQLLVSVHMAAAAEAGALLSAMDIDVATAMRVLSGGWGASAMVDRELPRALTGDFANVGASIGGLVEVQRLIADSYRTAGIAARLFPVVRGLFAEAVHSGRGAMDPAALVELYPAVRE